MIQVEKTWENFERIHDMMISGLASEHIQVSGEKGIGGQATNSPRESGEKCQQIVLNIVLSMLIVLMIIFVLPMVVCDHIVL